MKQVINQQKRIRIRVWRETLTFPFLRDVVLGSAPSLRKSNMPIQDTNLLLLSKYIEEKMEFLIDLKMKVHKPINLIKKNYQRKSTSSLPRFTYATASVRKKAPNTNS